MLFEIDGVPPHAEDEWHIRSANSSGPHINADISYYFGIDGKAEWRTMDTLDQSWVLKRIAHTYTGAQALDLRAPLLPGLRNPALPTAPAAAPLLRPAPLQRA